MKEKRTQECERKFKIYALHTHSHTNKHTKPLFFGDVVKFLRSFTFHSLALRLTHSHSLTLVLSSPLGKLHHKQNATKIHFQIENDSRNSIFKLDVILLLFQFQYSLCSWTFPLCVLVMFLKMYVFCACYFGLLLLMLFFCVQIFCYL